MKYRRLSSEELSELEKEFIDFLIVNGVTADVWVDLKADDKEKADSIIDSFSDVVFEGILRKTQYLDFVTPTSVKSFQCLANEIVLVGLDSEVSSGIDFTKNDWQSDFSDLKIYNSSKQYKNSREEELFNMIQNGASISNGELFKQLCLGL